jgi:hypothetical protein
MFPQFARTIRVFLKNLEIVHLKNDVLHQGRTKISGFIWNT